MFRIGQHVFDAVTFKARRDQFPNRLADAMIDHALRNGKRDSHIIQVFTATGWASIDHPITDALVHVTPQLAGDYPACFDIFDWASGIARKQKEIRESFREMEHDSIE